MIPRVIHFCWFGHGQYPSIFKQCFESWKKYCPDYEIKLWNEDSFDVNLIPFVKEAYEQKKWAFVVDYVRMYILNKEGGIYLETDTEILKPLDDLLDTGLFICQAGNAVTIPVLGAEKDNALLQAIMKYYEGRHFVLEDGRLDCTTVNNVVYKILTEQFHMVRSNHIQHLHPNITVYPERYFFTDWSSGRMRYTDSNYVIHYAEASWQEGQLGCRKHLERKYSKFLGNFLGFKLAFIVSFLRYRGVVYPLVQLYKRIVKR